MKSENKIIHGNCVDIMRQLPDESVDMVFADPPYFMQLNTSLRRPDSTEVKAVDDAWDKFQDFRHYDTFTLNWLVQARRILKPNGTLWVIGSYHNIFRLGYLIQTMGFWILNDIVWIKTNPMPNFKGTRFTNAHETLIWCAKSREAHYTFNYESMKTFNDDLQMRSDWYLPICNGRERLKDSQGKKVHTTQKPLSLLKRVILTATKPNDLILDPFFGTGTTGAVAKELGRRFIGIEQNESYIPYAKERIEKTSVLSENHLTPTEKKPMPKITFGMLLENGLLHIGDKLVDKRQKHTATIQADASLKIGRTYLSIHKMAARCQNRNAESSNGWTYWYLKTGNKIISIDVLRTQLRERLFPETTPDSFFVEKNDDIS